MSVLYFGKWSSVFSYVFLVVLFQEMDCLLSEHVMALHAGRKGYAGFVHAFTCVCVCACRCTSKYLKVLKY